MVKIAICDDELALRKELAEQMIQCAKLLGAQVYIKQYLDGKSLLAEQSFFHIVFMDIELGSENGFAVTEQYKKKYPHSIVIILTSHGEAMSYGYHVAAFRYLIKPISKEALSEALNSAFKKIGDDMALTIHDDGTQRFIHMRNIVYVEAGARSVVIRTLSHTYRDTRPIGDYEKILCSGQFYRVHKSYIVNMNYILTINQLVITTVNKEKIKISCKKQKEFRDVFEEFQWARGNE